VTAVTAEAMMSTAGNLSFIHTFLLASQVVRAESCRPRILAIGGP
jgi:hypothetical protein